MKVLICGDYIVYGDLDSKTNDLFGEFSQVISQSDIAIYNQEFPVTNSSEIYSTKKFGLVSATSPEAIYPLTKAGFKYATLANNHIFNRGITGLKDTVTNLKKAGIQSFGAGENIEQANKIFFIKNSGLNIAFLNYAENEFNTATEKHGGANPLDIINVVRKITEAKKISNLVFLIIHGGIDYCKMPSPRMVRLYRFFADMGVTAIIGHHSHVVSGYEVYNGVPIFYGIGNFIPGKIVTEGCLYSFPVQFNIQNDESVTFQGFPLKFNSDKGKLEILHGIALNIFLDDQKRISDLLKDLGILKKQIINEFLNKEREAYYFALFTQSNYFFFKLFRKLRLIDIYHKYIKRKMKLNRKRSALWNLFRCETHRDVLDLIYEKHVDVYKN